MSWFAKQMSKISKQDANSDVIAFTFAKEALQSPSTTVLSVLPADILDYIFRFVVECPLNIATLERCCKNFYTVINSDSLLRNSWATLLQRSGEDLALKEAKKPLTAKQVKLIAEQNLNDYRMVPLEYAMQYMKDLKKTPKKSGWFDPNLCKIAITGMHESFSTLLF